MYKINNYTEENKIHKIDMVYKKKKKNDEAMTFVLKCYKVKLSSSVQTDSGTLFHNFAALTRKVLLPLFELHLGTISVLEV